MLRRNDSTVLSLKIFENLDWPADVIVNAQRTASEVVKQKSTREEGTVLNRDVKGGIARTSLNWRNLVCLTCRKGNGLACGRVCRGVALGRSASIPQ